MTDLDLAAIRERANNATKGPWEHIRDSNYQLADCPPTYESLVTSDDGMVAILDWGNGATSSDAEFIAHARENVPALLDLVDTLTKRLAAIRELHILYTDIRELQWCYHCETPWPCPTRRALDGD